MATKQGMPYQAGEEVEDSRGAVAFKLERGQRDLYSVIHHSFTGNDHYYYVCDRLIAVAVCSYEELAFVLYHYLESGLSQEKFYDQIGNGPV